jgi:hypothetical protein
MSAGSILSLSTTSTSSSEAATHEIPGRVHEDYDSGTKYVSYFIPSGPEFYTLCEGVLKNPQWLFDAVKGVVVEAGYPGERMLKSTELRFSGRVFLYLEDMPTAEQFAQVEELGKQTGIDLVVRTPASAQERSRFEKPLAFICHDWRDKADIARPIAAELIRRRCPVWYDEYSLKVGASLRANVEKGLKECKKCVLVLSPNFLSNTGWTKTEFDSIFTRQILEGSNLVLPVWCGVSKQQIYEYSPSLLDRLGVSWDEGLEVDVGKLYRAIEPPLSNYTRL